MSHSWLWNRKLPRPQLKYTTFTVEHGDDYVWHVRLQSQSLSPTVKTYGMTKMPICTKSLFLSILSKHKMRNYISQKRSLSKRTIWHFFVTWPSLVTVYSGTVPNIFQTLSNCRNCKVIFTLRMSQTWNTCIHVKSSNLTGKFQCKVIFWKWSVSQTFKKGWNFEISYFSLFIKTSKPQLYLNQLCPIHCFNIPLLWKWNLPLLTLKTFTCMKVHTLVNRGGQINICNKF